MSENSSQKGYLIEDVLKMDLLVVFCGTALGNKSFERKEYYAFRGNKFWRMLHEVGFTPEQLDPSEYRRVNDFKIGLTDLCKFEHGMDAMLSNSALAKSACDELQMKIEKYRPKALAFTSLRAGRAFFGRKATLGWQTPIRETRSYILPSTSPANKWWPKMKHHWQILADALC